MKEWKKGKGLAEKIECDKKRIKPKQGDNASETDVDLNKASALSMGTYMRELVSFAKGEVDAHITESSQRINEVS